LFTVSTPFNPNLFIFSISSTSWARGALSSALSAENAFDAESYVYGAKEYVESVVFEWHSTCCVEADESCLTLTVLNLSRP